MSIDEKQVTMMSDSSAIHRVVEHVGKMQWQQKIIANVIDYSPIPQFAINKEHQVVFGIEPAKS